MVVPFRAQVFAARGVCSALAGAREPARRARFREPLELAVLCARRRASSHNVDVSRLLERLEVVGRYAQAGPARQVPSVERQERPLSVTLELRSLEPEPEQDRALMPAQ